MRHSLTGRLLWTAFLTAAVATGAALLVLNRPGHAAPAAAVPTLVLGAPYHSALRTGSRISVTFPPGSMSRGTRIDILAVVSGGSIVAEGSLTPSAADMNAGTVFGVAPRSTAKPDYWIALAPVAKTHPITLRIAPLGPRPPGTPLAAILTHVPAGADVYLLGLMPAGSGKARFAAYVPPQACIPDPPSTGMTICNFRAPPGYNSNQVSFAAFSTGGTVTSLPYDALPEVAWPASLPLIGLALGLIALRDRGSCPGRRPHDTRPETSRSVRHVP